MLKKFFTLLSAFSVVTFSGAFFGYGQILPDGAQVLSLSGQALSSAEPTNKMILENLQSAQVKYMDYPMDPENVLWYGRRLAYAGKFQRAIKIFSEGILDHPKDARFYRHRGHRYITVRQFDKAIADLEKAASLIQGKQNSVEKDGAPNKFNIPVSTLHHNIYYHLGLAYYLKQNFENAKIAFDNAYRVGTNDDNKVSVTHWRYMILRRMGKSHDQAKHVLEPISKDMNILENVTYHKLDLFYKGEVALEDMLENDIESSKDAGTVYGLANWYYYNGDKHKAREILTGLLNAKSWGSFGYIAAEADLAAMK